MNQHIQTYNQYTAYQIDFWLIIGSGNFKLLTSIFPTAKSYSFSLIHSVTSSSGHFYEKVFNPNHFLKPDQVTIEFLSFLG